MMKASQALRWARIFRMLWPQRQSTAKMASPRVPLIGDLDRLGSVFMWLISASMALRRSEIGDQLWRQVASCAADERAGRLDTMATIAAVDDGKGGRWSVRISTCSSVGPRVWPS